MGDEALGAVQHPVIAVAHRGGAHGGGVAARSGFGQTPGGQRAPGGQRHDVALLLRLGPEHVDVRGAQAVVRGHRQRHRRVDPGQLFERDAVVHRRHAGAAVGVGNLNAHQREVGQRRQQFRREVLGVIPVAQVRPDLALGELADAAREQHVVFGEGQVEHGQSRWASTAGAGAAGLRVRDHIIGGCTTSRVASGGSRRSSPRR